MRCQGVRLVVSEERIASSDEGKLIGGLNLLPVELGHQSEGDDSANHAESHTCIGIRAFLLGLHGLHLLRGALLGGKGENPVECTWTRLPVITYITIVVCTGTKRASGFFIKPSAVLAHILVCVYLVHIVGSAHDPLPDSNAFLVIR